MLKPYESHLFTVKDDRFKSELFLREVKEAYTNVSAKPDYITISMTIESVEKDYDKAMENAARRIENLKGAVVSAGYEKETLKTGSFNVETRYENVRDRQGNYKREFAGYACIYRLKLAFDFDSKQLAKVISAIATSGAQPELCGGDGQSGYTAA